MTIVKCKVSNLLILLVLLTSSANSQEARNAAFQLLDAVRIEQRIGEQVPMGVRLWDSNGEAVRLGDLIQDRPVILSLVYYECPMLCTQVLNGLLASLKALSFDVGSEFDVVTVSFDPKEGPDLAAKKKSSYIESYNRNGAETGWHFLSGDSLSIAQLTQSVGFHFVYQEEVDQFAHGSAVIILTPRGNIAQYHFGIEYAPRDIRLGLVEASNEEVGSIVDQVLLYCFHYDPTVGRYGVTILSVIRIAGGFTALLVVGGIVVLLRSERRPRTPAVEVVG